MLLNEVRYARPETLEEAIDLLGSEANARVLAGGQSLLNVMKHRIASPEVLVDLGRIQDLSHVEVAPDESVRIGAMTTYDDLDRSEELRETLPVISEVADGLVDQQVRNRGTIGGNLCYSDPTSNFPPLMVVLGATFVVTGPEGEREVRAVEFFKGAYSTDLRLGEILTGIRIPAVADDTQCGYASIRLSAHGWGLAHAAVRLRFDGEEISEARIALGCVAERPVRAETMERALQGRPGTPEVIREAANGIEETLSPVSDVHASGAYRARMAGVAARRAAEQACERSGG